MTHIQIFLTNTKTKFPINTQIDGKSTTVNKLISQSHELLSAFTEDEVFSVNRVQTRRMKRKEHSLQDDNEVINENSSFEDVKDFNINTKSKHNPEIKPVELKGQVC